MNIFDGRYEQLELIGRGGFSEVWKVRDTQTGVIQALKIYSPEKGVDDNGIEMLTREFALLCDANHPNLLRPSYFAICRDTSDLAHRSLPYLVLPFCQRGNISRLRGQLSERDAWILIRDVASALAYLHNMKPPIIHQDIKPENILIGNDGSYQLSDFGVSTQVRSTMNRASDAIDHIQSAGTISYMAPERFSRNNMPILANDIYSLGVMVFELLAGYLPFGNNGGLLQMKGAETPELPGPYSDLLKKTLDDCMQKEPWERPLAIQLAEIADTALSKSPTVIMDNQDEAKAIDELQLPKFWNKKIFAGAAIGIALVIVGVLGGYYLNKQTTPETIVSDSTSIAISDSLNKEKIEAVKPDESEVMTVVSKNGQSPIDVQKTIRQDGSAYVTKVMNKAKYNVKVVLEGNNRRFSTELGPGQISKPNFECKAIRYYSYKGSGTVWRKNGKLPVVDKSKGGVPIEVRMDMQNDGKSYVTSIKNVSNHEVNVRVFIYEKSLLYTVDPGDAVEPRRLCTGISYESKSGWETYWESNADSQTDPSAEKVPKKVSTIMRYTRK